VHKLVYYEFSEEAYSAIRREKQIKGGSRADKLKLVASQNPDWRDLYDDLTRVHRIEFASHALAMTTESSRQVVLEIFKRRIEVRSNRYLCRTRQA
jgi:hypothetical protein